MAISFVKKVTGNAATIAVTSVTAGNFLSLQTTYYRGTRTGAAETVPTDTNGTASTAVAGIPGTITGGVDEAGASIFYVQNAAAGTHTLTPQNNSGKNYTLIEWAGAATSGVFDVSSRASTNTAAHTAGPTNSTGTTATADALALASIGLGASPGSTDVGFTDPVAASFSTQSKIVNDAGDIGTFHISKILVSTGVYWATYAWTDNEATQGSNRVIAIFKSGGAAAAVNRIRYPADMSAMGVGGMLGGNRMFCNACY
jgi:hypothetical protein